MHLPNELVVAILERLGRSDLKSARLVCKTWSSYASGFLFDKIYVAPNRIDLEVFDAITQNPILSKCVRQLIYDGSEFVPDISKESYIRGLRTQTARLSVNEDSTQAALLTVNKDDSSPNSPDLQIKDWIYDATNRDFSLQDAIDKWIDRSLINRGYKKYQEHSVYQQDAIRSGEFVDRLVNGLSRLVHLKSVTLEGGWPFTVRRGLCEHHYGTPLARQWNPFHCCPPLWSWEPERENLKDPPDGACHYWNIIAGLIRSQRHIDEFSVGGSISPGIPPKVFERYDATRPNSLGLDTVALSGLKQLHLRLASCDREPAMDFCENIEGLPKVLGSMHSLRRLDLELSDSGADYPNLFEYDDVFPQVMTWDNLEKITLDHLASSTTDLLHLLLIQMPNLKYVELGTTQLFKGEGCWQSAIECLKQFNRFTTFEVDINALLFYIDTLYDTQVVLECNNNSICEYIMHGGRHPCLLDDQPASASEAYMLTIDASLRDRLIIGANSSRIDFAI